MASLDTLQTALDYRYRDQALLEQALTHRSHGMPHNERLEFLGDSVLNFIVSALLFTEHAEMDEGDLSRVRANLVKQSALADIAQKLSLSDYLRLGEGELKSGGFRRPSILADALEAIFGALYLDGGYDQVSRVIERLYRPVLSHIDVRTFGKDPKTLLQEIMQGRGLDLPHYEVVSTRGAAHNQTFDVVCAVTQLDVRVQASGSSRRAAEQSAAAQVIAAIEALGPVRRPGRRHRKSAQLSLPVAVSQEKT
ncbi:ribonuclease III [Castellaniella sp.]|uniref:ribonuclease III n=1 Tax=Castellaniella sp. TaxID=1955812 RepID=UPI002AFEC26E|nr:ribonuclease III [Castellaniella sp.]